MAPAAPDRSGRGSPPVAVLVATVVVAVVAAAIIGAMVLRDDPAQGPHVLVVGDSVTYQSAGDLVMAFDWTANLEVQGRPGFRTDELLPIAREALDGSEHRYAVVMTGYNDVWQEADTADAVAEMVELFSSVPCVVWVLLPTKGDYPRELATAFNDRIEELVAEREGMQVEGAWRDSADATDGDAPDPELVSDDGVHPTDGGTARIAEVMEAAVTRACR